MDRASAWKSRACRPSALRNIAPIQCRVPALPLIAGDVLDRGAARLACQLSQARLLDQVSAVGLDADRTDMLQALDHAEHGGRLGGLRHLSQPGQPTLAGLFPALRQRVQPMPLLNGEAVGQTVLHLAAGLIAEFGTEPLEPGRRWGEDPALPACLHHQPGEMGKPVIFDRLR